MSELGSVYNFNSDISKAEAPQPLPPGEYRGSVVHAELAVSKSSGKPMLVTQYRVSSDQFPPDFTDGNPEGELFRVYTSLEETPRGKFMVRKFMEMHGVAPSNRLNVPDFLGQEVVLNVSNEDYQGMPQGRAVPVRAA